MSEWTQVHLEDVANEVTVGYVGNMTSEYIDNGIPFLRSKNIEPFKINRNDIRYISEEFHHKIKKSALSPGDIAIVRTGNPGTATLIPDSLPVANCSDLVIVRPGPKIDKHYLVYYLNSAAKGHISANLVGAVQQHFNVGAAKKIQINLPALEEQKSIASVLSSLDNKIDLLHRQNKTLEAMAEALFRQWFVEGAGEDWSEGTIDDVVSIKGGTTPSTKEPEFWAGNIHWTSPRDLSNQESVFMFDTDRKITEKGLAQIGSGLMPVGTVLMSSRAPIGYLAITDIPVSINQGYIAIVCDGLVSNYFMYLWCKANMEEIKNSGNGSVFEEISKSSFKALLVVIPAKEVLDGFDSAVNPIFGKIRANQLQAKNLEKLRDGLLPKLMSGEVRVSAL